MSHSTCRFNWNAGRDKTGVEINFVADDKIRILPENSMRGGPTSVMGNPYEKGIGTTKIQDWDKNNFCRTCICQNLPTENFAEIEVTG